MCMKAQFQSTLPARGATRWDRRNIRYYKGISIHAPCTGSDTRLTAWICRDSSFQSTLPARGATRAREPNRAEGGISIHAPCTGSDISVPAFATIWSYFNPRSLHGERHRFLNSSAVMPISIHAPCTGSDVHEPVEQHRPEFQSTLPARGATGESSSSEHRGTSNFNPRSPHGERPAIGDILPCPRRISIHAPRTGSDSLKMPLSIRIRHFNPRSPHGERLGGKLHEDAPFNFNPRSPHGERLADELLQVALHIDFNPRSPHGERRY